MHLILKQYSTLRSNISIVHQQEAIYCHGANGPTKCLHSVQYNLRQTISETFIILQFRSQASKSQVMHASVGIIILPKSPLYPYYNLLKDQDFRKNIFKIASALAYRC